MTAPNPPRPITIRRTDQHDPWVVKSPAHEGWCYEVPCPTWDEAITEADHEAARLRTGQRHRHHFPQVTFIRELDWVSKFGQDAADRYMEMVGEGKPLAERAAKAKRLAQGAPVRRAP